MAAEPALEQPPAPAPEPAPALEDYQAKVLQRVQPTALRLCESRLLVAFSVGLLAVAVLAVLQPPLVRRGDTLCGWRLAVWGAVAGGLVFAAPLVVQAFRKRPAAAAT